MKASKKQAQQALLRRQEEELVAVDKSKWGANYNTYAMAPDFYYDQIYQCVDCGVASIWTAREQKYWFEILGKYVSSKAVHCDKCRAHRRALKIEQKKHMAEIAKKEPHPNEAFFKKDGKKNKRLKSKS